jgi:alpha-glucosidase
LTWLEGPDGVVGYARGEAGWQVWTNFTDAPVTLPPGEILLASADASGQLPGPGTVWVKAPGAAA